MDAGDAGIPDASIPDASDARGPFDSGCGGSDSGCGCGRPPPAYDAGETLAGDLQLFDGAAPDGACPPLTFGVAWGGAPIAAAMLFRGCKNTTLFVTSSCGAGPNSGGVGDWMVFDAQGHIVGATQMSSSSCVSTGPAPDYIPCGADASWPPPCEVLCGCDSWKCRPFDDAGGIKDGGAD